MDDSSSSSNLEILVFYLTNSDNLEVISLDSVNLVNKDNKSFRIIAIQRRPNNPLLTLVDDTDSKKLYSAQSLKPPYWSKADIDSDILNLLKRFYESSLLEKQAKSDELNIKKANNFKRVVDDALQKHKNILETSLIEYKGYSRLERAYSSHCYKCKQPVSNKSNYMCNACNHLICNKCGNCKCLFVDLHN